MHIFFGSSKNIQSKGVFEGGGGEGAFAPHGWYFFFIQYIDLKNVMYKQLRI
jgi:hypothetical protein